MNNKSALLALFHAHFCFARAVIFSDCHLRYREISNNMKLQSVLLIVFKPIFFFFFSTNKIYIG